MNFNGVKPSQARYITFRFSALRLAYTKLIEMTIKMKSWKNSSFRVVLLHRLYNRDVFPSVEHHPQ